LSWSHYYELLSISDSDKRSFYEKEAINSNWSVRELKRQIDSSLFEHLLLSRGDANKEKVLELALHGNEISVPADIIRDPYVFEFGGIPEDKPIMKRDIISNNSFICFDSVTCNRLIHLENSLFLDFKILYVEHLL